ncbi:MULTISPECIES: hypothetical protein [unclassified Mesorhizobium]|uniref:hypothetical protein n=1 Tax=unclassified Mesorhizobium TaxID=325217 RepID=UPI003339E336
MALERADAKTGKVKRQVTLNGKALDLGDASAADIARAIMRRKTAKREERLLAAEAKVRNAVR